MINKKRKIFCFILARGGSKGLPRKNVRLLAGKPLIAHTINLAKSIPIIDEVYVSTEDQEIKKISLKCGAHVIDRPSELATDTSSYLDAVKHMIQQIPESKNNPIIVLLQTTSPIRSKKDVKNCIKLLEGDVDCVVSISLVKKHPSRMFRVNPDDGLLTFYLGRPPNSNRQEEEILYEMNGSIFVSDVNFLLKQNRIVLGGKMKGYLLDEIHSIDIDTSFDFEICKYFMEQLHK